MATYGPGIDQSQHMKSISHIIRNNIKVLRGGGWGLGKNLPKFHQHSLSNVHN